MNIWRINVIFKKVCRIFFGLFLLVGISWMVGLPGAQAWWNEEWQYRKNITLDTTAAGADIRENIPLFPVLIRLHSGNFDFTRVKENGEDIRFVGNDDITALKYHIEVFDAVNEIALIWVSLPVITGGSNQEGIWVYYGNTAAAAGGDSKTTYDAFSQGVYHFSEVEGAPKDAASYATHASRFTGGSGLAGVIGNGAGFFGTESILEIPDHPAFNFSSGFTFSTWIKLSEPQNNAVLFSRASEGKGLFIAIRGTGVFVSGNDGKQPFETSEAMDLPLESWHHLAVTIAQVGRVTLYLNGVETKWIDTKFDLSAIKGNLLVGGETDGKRSFKGDLDELGISGATRSGAWVRAAFVSQGPDADFFAFAEEELNKGTTSKSLVYLHIVASNITEDGYVIIGFLLIFLISSWTVMITKTRYLYKTSRGDRNFLELQQKTHEPFSIKSVEKGFENSGLYRIYQAGLNSYEFLKKSAGGTNEGAGWIVSVKYMNNLKAALERQLVEEAKKLNAWLQILTMCVSGGPFLGLLGTVWGVMNTFAAMADAGEANIMAIAPGVASALACTVFGLIVAIPALYGYTFLSAKVREITIDNGIFVDQFTLNIETVYGGK